jgi:prepilin-type N-terminal cleavage/methylation domain-containing protein
MLFARTSGFTLIEVMVGMTIFAIGMTGIFVLLQVGIGTAGSARYEVVATNLLREQIELVRNNRDTNYAVYRPWNEACIDADCAKILIPGTYIVENNFANDIFTYDYVSTPNKTKTRSVSFKSISPVPTPDIEIFNQAKLYIDEK